MTHTQTPGHSPSSAMAPLQSRRSQTRDSAEGSSSAHLQQLQASLTHIVGSHGTQALMARVRHLCGERATSRFLQTRTLLQLVSKLLGEPLAGCLSQTDAPLRRDPVVRSRLR